MAELAPGFVVAGRFVLDRLIGEGGMGMVWAATHTVTGKSVALKVLKPGRAGDPVVRARFIREARAVCAVRHPSIVQIHDVLEMDDGAPVMVMDLLRGESLGERLERETRLPVDQVARILIPAVNAVGTAHAAGIVHRDLKPDNIFLTDQGGLVVPLVLDFGIAKIQAVDGDAAALALTGTGALLGTPFYMAPEQIFGERDIDHRVDVWAVGVILYECLSGSRPTQAENMGQILRIITTDSIVPLELVAPGVPPELAELVGRMLQRDRKLRPSSMAEVEAVLHRHAPDVVTRPHGDAAILARSSSPSFDGGSRSHVALDTSGARAVISRTHDVSPTAATLASTTASTTADRAALVAPTRSRASLVVASALVLGVAIASTALYVATRPSPHAASPSGVLAELPSVTASVAPPTAPMPAPSASGAPQAPGAAPTAMPSTAPARPMGPRPTASASRVPPAPSIATPPNAYDHM